MGHVLWGENENTYLLGLTGDLLIVVCEGGAEDDASDILKEMDPLPPVVLLPMNLAYLNR
jgi:hypothetical protein